MTTRKIKTKAGDEIVVQDGTVTAYYADGSSDQVSFGTIIRLANPQCVDAAVARFVGRAGSPVVEDRKV